MSRRIALASPGPSRLGPTAATPVGKEHTVRSRRVPLAVASALLLVVAFAAPAAATRGQPELAVPIQISIVSPADEPLDMSPGFPVVGDTFGGRCSAPSSWVTTINSAGDASRLGHVAVHQSHCTQINVFAPPPLPATFADGRMTVTAANGDELWIAYTGSFLFYPTDEATGLSVLTYSMTIVGGTGRFTGASGSLTGSAEDNFPAGPHVATFIGTITYDASHASGR